MRVELKETISVIDTINDLWILVKFSCGSLVSKLPSLCSVTIVFPAVKILTKKMMLFCYHITYGVVIYYENKLLKLKT